MYNASYRMITRYPVLLFNTINNSQVGWVAALSQPNKYKRMLRTYGAPLLSPLIFSKACSFSARASMSSM